MAPEGIGGGGEGVITDPTQAADATNSAVMQQLLIAGQTQTAQALSGEPGVIVVSTAVVSTPVALATAIPLPTSTPLPAAVTGPISYTVKSGDWLYQIAREHNVDPGALIAANPQINPNAVLEPGTVITIPGSSTPVPAAATTGEKTYVVKAGDNLFRIGLNNATTYLVLAQLNNIPAPYTVYPGQVLKLP
ncbi:MAG: LysM peptidoglycan-binding domain-containing protein [Chloroflexi bacterium]|nr:LysM peptidoglycan-binding domain-containing protein [Chloroflexota bacterium]